MPLYKVKQCIEIELLPVTWKIEFVQVIERKPRFRLSYHLRCCGLLLLFPPLLPWRDSHVSEISGGRRSIPPSSCPAGLLLRLNPTWLSRCCTGNLPWPPFPVTVRQQLCCSGLCEWNGPVMAGCDWRKHFRSLDSFRFNKAPAGWTFRAVWTSRCLHGVQREG